MCSNCALNNGYLQRSCRKNTEIEKYYGYGVIMAKVITRVATMLINLNQYSNLDGRSLKTEIDV